MTVYKLIFAKNEIISCNLLAYKVEFKGDYYYEYDKDQLIYAMVKAESEAKAISKSYEIIKDLTGKKIQRTYDEYLQNSN